MSKCPLCFSNKVHLIEKINKNNLIALYKKKNVDVSSLLTSNIDYVKCEQCHLYFFDPLVTGDEQFYNQLQHNEWYYANEKSEYQYATQYIKSTDKVLDVGSGKGAFAKYLPSKEYTGLDFSINAKLLAEKDGLSILNEAIEDHSQQYTGYYDVVCSFQVLEHVADPKKFLDGKIKALRAGGILIISVPAEDSFLKYAVNAALNMPPHHVTRWPDITLEQLPTMFPLQCIAIHHEVVQPSHKKWFCSVFVRHVLARHRLVDKTLKGNICTLISDLFAEYFFKTDMQNLLPNGHTVTAVYIKQ